MKADGRSRRYEHRRPEILDAVLEHLLEHGAADLSYRTLAAAVGVSHVTLRHHFGAKEELMAEVFDLIRVRQPIPEGLSSGADGVALIEQLWERWTNEEGLRYFRLLFEIYGQALREPDRFRRLLDGVVKDWVDLIGLLATDAGCPPDQAPAFATFLLAQLRGLQLDLLATGDHARVGKAHSSLISWVEAQRITWRTHDSKSQRRHHVAAPPATRQ